MADRLPRPSTSGEPRSTPTRPGWFTYVVTALTVLVLMLLVVSLGITTWRQLFPRPPVAPAPVYVCVYVSGGGVSTVTGSTPCPRPASAVMGRG